MPFSNFELGNQGIPAWQKAYAYDDSNNCIFEGWATPGTATSAGGWIILMRTFSGSNVLTEKLATGGSWDSRASLTYA